MSSQVEVRTSEDARQEAERHRQEITDTLDALGNKLNQTVQRAEQQITRPLQWVRQNPWAALALGTAAGFLSAAAPGMSERRKGAFFLRELEQAYYAGREDERFNRPPREWPDWREHLERINREARSQSRVREALFDVLQPVLQNLRNQLTASLTGTPYEERRSRSVPPATPGE